MRALRIIFFLFISIYPVYSQSGQQFVGSNIYMRGMIKDTVFNAISKYGLISMDYSTGQLIMKVKPYTFSTGKVNTDKIIREITDLEISYTANLGSIFDIDKQKYSDRDFTATGILTIGNISKELNFTYKINTIGPAIQYNSGRNTSELPYKISFNIFFSSTDFGINDENYFNHLMEIEAIEGYVNRIN
jgi:hypothetical protein